MFFSDLNVSPLVANFMLMSLTGGLDMVGQSLKSGNPTTPLLDLVRPLKSEMEIILSKNNMTDVIELFRALAVEYVNMHYTVKVFAINLAEISAAKISSHPASSTRWPPLLGTTRISL